MDQSLKLPASIAASQQVAPSTGSGLIAMSRSLVASVWRLANVDFCPRQNRWAYALKNPVAYLSAASVLGLFCGAVINPLAYLLGGTLVAVLVIGLAWPAIAVRTVVVEVDWGRKRVAEGQPVDVTVRLRNRLPIPVAGVTIAGLGGVENAKLPVLRPRERRHLTWQATAKRRGIFPLASVELTDESARIETQMPFGVWTATRPVPVAGRLVVHPSQTTLDGLADLGEPCGGEEQATDRRAGTTGDLLGVRRFREGDSLRHVHWAQTARQRELIVTERQATVSSTVRVGVDLPRDADQLEVALRAAASVASRLVAGGMAVEIVLPDGSLRCDGSPIALLDGLAAVTTPERDRPSPNDVSVRIGFDPRCRLRLDEPGPGEAWRPMVAAAWRRLCRAA